MKIGLTYTGSDDKHLNYERWLRANDNMQIVKLSAESDNVRELGTCNGLVLAGGLDIHPAFYKNDKTDYAHAPERFDKKRDAFEIAAFKLAQELGLPVVGICRGMQLVNCILSGTLKQDLGDTLNTTHRAGSGSDQSHELNIEPDTIMRKIVQAPRGVVNSAHHQSVDKLGQGLKASGVADDGTIEAMEWKDPSNKPFLLCVQWHPERMFRHNLQASPLSAGIRNTFIEAAKSRHIHESH